MQKQGQDGGRAGTGPGADTRGRTPNGDGDGNEGSREDENGNGNEDSDDIVEGKELRIQGEGRKEDSFRIRHIRK